MVNSCFSPSKWKPNKFNTSLLYWLKKKRVGQRTFFSVLHERINMSLPCKNGQVAGLLLFHTNKRQTDVHPAYGGLVNVPYIRYMGEFFFIWTWILSKLHDMHPTLYIFISSTFHVPYAPWCWYIYLHNWVIFRANDGTYSSTMEHMGLVVQSLVSMIKSLVSDG